MPVSVRTKTNFPLLTTTALASTALMSAALLTVGPTAAKAQTISTPVMATQNLGPGGVLIVTGSGSISGVSTAVNVNGVGATSVTNDGSISGIANGIRLQSGATISGGFTNSGTVIGSTDGISILTNSDITGGIVNSGTISGGSRGIAVDNTSSIYGGITNSGTISGWSIGIFAVDSSVISGITNNAGGVISGGGIGIRVRNNSDITTGIINSGTISGVSRGVSVQSADITGGITNSGTISGGTAGIWVLGNSNISGGVNSSGTISGGTGNAISVLSASNISGGITNSGMISGIMGIRVGSTSDISGGITNNAGGTISGDNAGISVFNNSNLGGGITNYGAIFSSVFSGITLGGGSNVSGGITNASGGVISGVQGGIQLASGSSISGGIVNAAGAVISGGSYGILHTTGLDIAGGIENSGTITGGTNAIFVSSSHISGGITNEVGGIIEGTGGTAISLPDLSAATPITINGGRIIGDVIDNTPSNGFSETTIAGDFTTEGNFTVSGLTVSAGQIFTISAGNTVTLDDMSSSAGTFSFAVDSAMSAGQLIVTNGNVDLSGATVSATVLNAGANLMSGDEILIADGSVQVVGLTGAPGQVATTIADNSILWNFLIADGDQSAVTTGGADDTQIYMIAMQVAMAADTATTPNNRAAGAVFDDLRGTSVPELSSIIDNIDNAGTAAELDAILEATLPTVDGGALAGGLRLSQNTLDITRTQLASLRDGKATGMAAGDHPSGLRAWGQVFGESADQDRRDSVAGYDAQTLGIALGFDTQNAAEDTTLGLALSYGHTDVESDNTNRTETDVDGYQVTLYGDHDFDDRTYVYGLLGYVYGDNESTRHDVGGVAGLTANADYASHQFVAEVETGRDYKAGAATLTPHVLASYTHYSAEDYTETGAGGANLNVENEDLQMLELGIGVNAGWEHQTAAGGVLEPELRAGYRYDVIGDPVASTARFTGGGAAFKTEGFDPAQSRFNVGTGVTYTTPNNWELSASYDYEFKQDFDAHSGFLKAAYKF